MPQPATTLIFRADYETATSYLAAYLQTVVDRARQLGWNVVDLRGSDATQANFMSTLESSDPLLVIAGGHGSEGLFTGQGGESVLVACQNDEVMSGRQGIFHSCSVGVQLGPSMVEKTAEWFAGWRSDYIFMYSEGVEPLRDEVARCFMECLIQPALSKVEGASASAVYSQTMAKFNGWINHWWFSLDPAAGEIITYLIHDRDNFMVTGVSVPEAGLGTSPLPILIIGGVLLVMLA